MGWPEVKANFDFLKTEQVKGSLRWHKDVADTFTRLLGSGYIAGSIRSLWGVYPKSQRTTISLLIELADHWRTYLRDNRVHEQLIQDEFVRISQVLLECVEGRCELPSSSLFEMRDGVVYWKGEVLNPGK